MPALFMYMEPNMSYIERIVNAETNEIIEREYTKEEIAEAEIGQAIALEKTAKLNEMAAAKSALLEKLGITEEEAKLLLS